MQIEIMYKILTGTRWACCSVHFSRDSRANTSLQQKHTVSVTSHTPSPLRNNAKASSCKFTAVPAAAPPLLLQHVSMVAFNPIVCCRYANL